MGRMESRVGHKDLVGRRYQDESSVTLREVLLGVGAVGQRSASQYRSQWVLQGVDIGAADGVVCSTVFSFPLRSRKR
jgi:hypothetical protein